MLIDTGHYILLIILIFIFFSTLFLVAPLIARHFKPPSSNIPLSPGTQIPPNVTIDVGQDAIVANGTTVLIRCNITQVSNLFLLCKVLNDFMNLLG